jgi:pimeloyl-ACP methyl ester carboxylesterase
MFTRLLLPVFVATAAMAQNYMTVKSADGTSIAFRKSGSGPALLLVHGSATTSASWFAVTPALSERFTVYAMDRRGRAPSGDGPAYSLDAEADDLAAVIAAINEPVVLVAHSYGAVVSLRAAAKPALLKSVSRLILYEPPFQVKPRPEHAKLVDEVKRAWAANDRDQVTALLLTEAFGAQRVEAVKSSPAWPALVALADTIPREVESVGRFRVSAKDLAAWKTPTTMLVGSESPAYMREGAEFVCASAQVCRIVTLEGQGHGAATVAPALFVSKVLEAAR